MQRVAIIDMGTNTFHLLIANVEKGKYELVLDEKQAVGLGKGGINEGFITDSAQDRALSALHSFKKTMLKYDLDKVVVTGTSAVRSAKNQSEFISRIKRELNWDVRVLTGEQEADGIYQGVEAAVKIPKRNAIIIDIGGGSVEFIICNAIDGVLWKKSIEIGGQRLMDRFLTTDPITKTEIEDIQVYLNEMLKPLINAVSNLKEVTTLIGSSGSFDSLCEIYCVEHGIDLKGETGFSLPLEAYHNVAKSLLEKNRAERLAVAGMIDLRVDMIIVALVLINWIVKELTIEKIEISFYALKEGLLKQVISSENKGL